MLFLKMIKIKGGEGISNNVKKIRKIFQIQFGAGRRPPNARQNDGEAEDHLDEYFEILGCWERGRSRSRRTQHESIEVRLHDCRAEDEEERQRILAAVIECLLQRVIGNRQEPLLIGFSLQPPGWERPYHIPLRPPRQNTAPAIAAAILKLAQDYEELKLFGRCLAKVIVVWPLRASNSNGFFVYLCGLWEIF